MNPLEAEAARQRRALLARERLTQRQLVAAYGETFRRVRAEILSLTRRIGEAQRAGLAPAQVRALLDREQQLTRFLQVSQEQLARFILFAEPALTGLQQSHAQQAIGDTHTLTDLALGPRPPGVGWEFAPPPPTVIHRLVGNASDGTPLGSLLREVAGAQLHAARTELLVGVARGQNPRVIGRAMARTLGQTATRSIVIARQESLRAYRQVTAETMRANSATTTGWAWSSAGDLRTCGVCWAMTGTIHPLSEDLVSHISCRCCQVPQTVSWAELGFDGIPDTRLTVGSGVDGFARLTAAEQTAILGPGKAAAYRSGQIALPDLVGRTRSERWGDGLRERPLRDLAHA